MRNKIIKYLLSSLFVFFVVSGVTKAEDRTIYIPRNGNQVELINGIEYSNVHCNGTDQLKYFTVIKKPNTNYYVRLKDNLTVSSGSESITCSYGTRFALTGGTREIVERDGTMTFTFTFSSSVDDMKVNATLSKYDPILDVRNYLPNFKSIQSAVLLENGEQYLDNQCMGDQCSFQVKEETFNTLNGNDIEVNGTVIYTTSEEQSVTVQLHIIIRAFYNIIASDGGYGTCNFTSPWEVNDQNSYKVKYDDSTRGSITLPNCDASNSAAAAKFYGWVYINPNDSIQESQNVMVSNVCKTYPKVEGNLELLINSGVDKFYTCYETTGSLYLNPAGGTIDTQASWKEQNGKYLIVQDADFVLPEIKQLPSYLKNDENNKVTYYWQASNDRHKKYKPGDVVTPSGQTFTAIYETDTFIENHLYEYSIMYAGEQQLYSLTSVKFDKCYIDSSSNEFVKVNPDSATGGCMMEAKKPTGEQIIKVYGYNAEQDQKYTLNLKILSRNGTTEGGDEKFIIKFDEYAIAGYGQTGGIISAPTKPGSYESGAVTSESVANPSCTKYKITTLYKDEQMYNEGDKLGSYVAQFFYPTFKGKVSLDDRISSLLPPVWPAGERHKDWDVDILHHDSFRATCMDSSQDPNRYATVCLDPSAAPPKEAIEKDPKAIGVPDEVVNFLYYVIQNPNYQSQLVEVYDDEDGNPIGQKYHQSDVKNKVRIAVNFVSRYLNAKNGTLRTIRNNYGSYYYYFGFMYLVDHYNEGIFKDGNGIDWNPYYKGTINELLKDVYDGIDTPDIHTTSQSNVESEINGNVATFRGKLSLPDDIRESTKVTVFDKLGDNVKAKMVCAAGLKCEIVSISQTDFEFNVTFDDPEKLKDMENIKMYLYFKTYKDKRSLVFLDDTSGITQRMVIFKDDQVYVFRYGGEARTATCDLNDFGGDPYSWDDSKKQEFINKNCCQLITNRHDPRYQAFCGDGCSKVTYSIACDTNLSNNAVDRDYDLYSVKEGYDELSKSEQIGTCVVDVAKATKNDDDERKNTERITDAVGNNLNLPLSDYDENQYCRVSCKEDWNLKTPGFKNFVGENGAVKAGQYFRLNEEIFLGGTRTCYTTFIDYDHYKDDIKILSGKMVAAYNTYNEAKTAYENAKAQFGKFIESYDGGNPPEKYPSNPYGDDNTKYITGYTKTGESREVCRIGDADTVVTTDKAKKDCKGTVVTQYKYSTDTKVCPIYNVHIPDGIEIKPFYNTVSFQNLAGKKTHGMYYNTTFTFGTDKSGWHDSDVDPAKLEGALGSCESANIIASLDPSSTDGIFDKLIAKLTYQSNNDQTTFNIKASLDYKRYENYIDSNDDIYGIHSGKLEDIMKEAKDDIYSYQDDLKEKVKEMGACQNFYMNNTIDDTDNYFYGETPVENAYNNINNGYGYYATDRYNVYISPTEIASPYEPDIRYQYEEYEYMTLVGNNNYLIPDAKENNKVVGEGAQNICKDTDIIDENGKPIQLCVNKINTYGYQDNGGWLNDSDNGKTYGGNVTENHKSDTASVNVNDSEIANEDMMVCDEKGCYSGKFYYYKLNYIKQSLSNGGYYRNYGDFYTSQYSDVKIFAASRTEALNKANANGSVVSDWGPLGGNSFPISLDTRRNIYQYMYSFGNIGIYNDTNTGGSNPTKGRIIGGYSSGTNTSTSTGGESVATSKPAVVAEHTHACFYEVFEELCQCCGLPVTSTAVTKLPSKVDTKGELSNYGYQFSDDNKNSSSATLGFYNTTVSLYDLDGKPNKEELSTNWSDNDTFRVYGNTYSTNKGGQLADAIVGVGEEIYNREPEYSYTLDPAAMAEIRDYNELHGYEHSISAMTNYGACAVASDSGECNTVLSPNYTEDETIVFAHYGSKFLEDLDEKYTTENHKNLSTRKKICSISSSELNNGDLIDLYASSYKDCRWVDYVMDTNDAKFIKGDNTVVEMNDVTRFRLAFK